MLVETKASKLKETLRTLTTVLAQKVDGECLVTADKQNQTLLFEGFRDGTYLKCTIPATVHQEGEVVVKVAYLTSLRLKDTVRLQLSGFRLDFTSGKFRGHVETSQDVMRFKDNRPKSVIETPFNLACEDFVSAMKRAYLQPTLVGQPYGIRCNILGDPEDVTKEAKIVMSSVESSVRAVLVEKPLPNVISREEGQSHIFFEAMLPPVVWSIVSKIKGPIQIGTDSKAFRLLSATFDLHQPLLNLDIPDIEQYIALLPENDKSGSFVAPVSNLLEGITQAASVVVNVGTMSQEINMDCSMSNNALTVAVNAVSGEATSDIPLESSTEGTLTFRLGSRHITESLGLLGDGNVEVAVWSQPSAVLVYSGPEVNETEETTEEAKKYQMKTSYVIPQSASTY